MISDSNEIVKKVSFEIISRINPEWTDLQKIRFVYIELGKYLEKNTDFFLNKKMTNGKMSSAELLEIYQELIQARTDIFETYHTSVDDQGNYLFEDEEKSQQANKELNDLMLMPQTVNFLQFDIDALGDQILTTQQMEVLMPMIKDEEE